MPEAASPGPVVATEGRVQAPLRPQRLCSLTSRITSWPSRLRGPCAHNLTATLQTLRGCHRSPAPSQVPDLLKERLPTLTVGYTAGPPDFARAVPSGRNAFPAFAAGQIPYSTPCRRRVPAPARDPAFQRQ